MHRIDHATKDVDLFGSGKHGFTEGTPGTEAATVVTDDWLNGVQEEICNVIESTDTLVKGTRDQLLTTLGKFFTDLALSNWSMPTPAAANSLAKGATDGNITCFVEFGGAIQYTYDGINYTRVVLGGALRDIAYGNGYWVAVGTSGSLYYAADPTGAWTSNTQGSTTFNSVYYGNGIWVVVGASGTVRHTTDPTGAWTSNTQGSAEFQHVVYANSMWVAVGASGTVRHTTDPTGAWTSNTQGSNTLNSVAYGDLSGTGTWIAVGDANTIYTTTNPTGSWTSRTSAAQSGAVLRDTAYGANCFVVVGDTDLDTQTRGIQRTFNGSTFVNKPSIATEDYIYGCVYAVDRFYCVGTNAEIQQSLGVGGFWL